MARAGRVGTARGRRRSPCPLQWLPFLLAPVFLSSLSRPHLFFYSLNSQKILVLRFLAELLTVLTHFYCFGFHNVFAAFSRCSSQLFMEILPKPARWFAQVSTLRWPRVTPRGVRTHTQVYSGSRSLQSLFFTSLTGLVKVPSCQALESQRLFHYWICLLNLLSPTVLICCYLRLLKSPKVLQIPESASSDDNSLFFWCTLPFSELLKSY